MGNYASIFVFRDTRVYAPWVRRFFFSSLRHKNDEPLPFVEEHEFL